MKSITLTVMGGELAPVTLTDGELRIGSAADSELVLSAPGVQPRHARITLDEDGAMLRLAQPDLGVRLNHRQVESLAFLHDGDLIEIAGIVIPVQVQGERATGDLSEADPDDRATRVRRVAPKYVLRGVTGSQFGKLLPIYGRMVIGRGSDCDLVLDEAGLSRRHAVIETLPDGLFLRDLGSANGSYVNGTRVRDTVLKHGDQIVLDNVRFLVQAIDQLDQPSVVAPVRRAGTGQARWWGWIILAVAVFAAGVITTLLLLR